ncbi:MAG: hypothetical protein EU541_01635 [Promethearchaeota archaeon]|nr:MAG: hypothetical protein EU541_01635 [Candidatus Lokiarchaeota archaeon]
MQAKIVQITDNLFISDYISEENFFELDHLGINAIVNLSLKDDYDAPSEINYLHVGFPDGSYIPYEKLEEIYTFIHREKQEGKILIHCLAGVSRSAGILIGQLMIDNPDWTWNDAYNFVKEKKWIMPANEIKESIKDFISFKRRNKL